LSLLYTSSCHSSPPTILSSSHNHLAIYFLVYLLLSLDVFKFIYDTFLGILFSSILFTCANQCNLCNLIVSFMVGFINNCINFFIGLYPPFFFLIVIYWVWNFSVHHIQFKSFTVFQLQ
jgi:hypothetical protein